MKPQMTFEAGEEKLHLPSSPQQMSHLRQPRIVLVVLTFLSLYGLFQLQGRKSHALSTSSSSLSKVAPVCSPEQWSKGEWTVKDEKHRSESSSVMEISGFKGCASTFVPSWHLGVGSPDNEMLMGSYRRRASNYVWKSTDPSCDKVGGACPYALIQNLITRGGWLLIGGEHHHHPRSIPFFFRFRICWLTLCFFFSSFLHLFTRTDGYQQIPYLKSTSSHSLASSSTMCEQSQSCLASTRR